MSIQQDDPSLNHFRESSAYMIVATLWSLFLLLLGIVFLSAREHVLIAFLVSSIGVQYAPSAAITFMSFGILLWRLFTSALIPTRNLFLVCTLVPLIPYAVANVMLVARGQRQSDLVVLMLGLIGSIFISWYFAERDAAQQVLIRQLSARVQSLEHQTAHER